jgi:cyclopropane-fatty-acyl-phospholipid synthase
MFSKDGVTTGTSATEARGLGLVDKVLDAALIRPLAAALAGTPAGRLVLTLPSGRKTVVGPIDREVAGELVLNNYRVLAKLIVRGQLGFADSYMAGDIDTDSLVGLFNYYMESEQALTSAVPSLIRSGWIDRMFHIQRANTPAGSRRNIAAHYDLGNEFYRLWLDPGLNYSSGAYVGAETSLEAAQDEKYNRILNALEISAGDDLLEIGCGWGGFAEAAANRGARVAGITISEQQFGEASARIERAGLAHRAIIRLEDYRDTAGMFDRVASIEMIEAVGEENWPIYFRSIADRLKPGGIAVIQAITIREDLYESYRRNPDFIQRYIFPGGMLPTEHAMRRHAEAAEMKFEALETFGESYALTLVEWRRRFDQAWPRIEALGFDERFRRMWSYYLAYCQVGFERKTIDVGLYRLVKPS